jgi:hypothetical protein
LLNVESYKFFLALSFLVSFVAPAVAATIELCKTQSHNSCRGVKDASKNKARRERINKKVSSLLHVIIVKLVDFYMPSPKSS